MKVNEVMQSAINDQIQKEFASAYLYLAMSAYFENLTLPGFAAWLRKQFEEEQEHALKLYDYLVERGGEVELMAIPQPHKSWSSPLQAFREVLAHENKVTQSIHDLYALAVKHNDYPTQVMLHWFIDEQVEEEANASQVVANLERVEAHDTAILMLDHQLGKRDD
jgi:ferritin